MDTPRKALLRLSFFDTVVEESKAGRRFAGASKLWEKKH